MGLALTATLALCLWVAMWGLGVKGFDGILLTMVIVVIGATVKSLLRYLPGVEPKKPSRGW